MPTGQNIQRQLERREREQRENAATAARYKEKYQGWTNWATWNVALWLGNAHDVYLRYQKVLEDRGPFTPERAEIFVRSVWPHGTPDMTSTHHRKWGKLADVDWRAIANDMNGE